MNISNSIYFYRLEGRERREWGREIKILTFEEEQGIGNLRVRKGEYSVFLSFGLAGWVTDENCHLDYYFAMGESPTAPCYSLEPVITWMAFRMLVLIYSYSWIGQIPILHCCIIGIWQLVAWFSIFQVEKHDQSHLGTWSTDSGASPFLSHTAYPCWEEKRSWTYPTQAVCNCIM